MAAFVVWFAVRVRRRCECPSPGSSAGDELDVSQHERSLLEVAVVPGGVRSSATCRSIYFGRHIPIPLHA